MMNGIALRQLLDILLGWPLLVYVIVASVIVTIAFGGIQFRAFVEAWRLAFFPEKDASEKGGEISPVQAFMSAVNIGLGNGSIAGMATAICSGGPGSVFWLVIFGFLMMALRFAEVYASTFFGAQQKASGTLGGPMLYLQYVAGGGVVSYIYALFCLLFSLCSNTMQTNSMSVSLYQTCGISPLITGGILVGIVLYIVLGGATRIATISEKIVPVKVVVFLASSLAVLIYNYQSLISAMSLIISSAFVPTAVAGGALGFTIQQAIQAGMTRSFIATESGLGTIAVLFGFTGAKEPVESGIMSMLSTFMSTLVCFIVGLCIVSSGVWQCGLTSTALTIKAFEGPFGVWAGWIVTFLSVSFGLGVLVAHAYIARAVWLFFTKGAYEIGFVILYAGASFFGAVSSVALIWDMVSLVTVGLAAINLFGLLYLIPQLRPAVQNYFAQNK